MQHFIRLAGREYSFNQRVFATLAAGLLFAIIIPFTLIKQGPRLDAMFGLPGISRGFIPIVLSLMFIAVGLIYGFWSILSQLLRARGTPLPVMPTKKLLVSGPFKQCRNPMTFGTILLYLGISLFIGSVSAIVLVLIFGTLLLTYIKLVEEHELEARFGQQYLDYKANTPFFIPRIF